MRKQALYIVILRQYMWIVLLLGTSSSALGNVHDDISTSLQKAGFENIRVMEEDSMIYISYENTIYRWNVKGIVIALDSISAYAESSSTLHVILLSMGIPQVAIETKASDWIDFRNGALSAKQYDQQFSVSYKTDNGWKKLNNQSSVNASYWKPDVVFYTQIKLTNVYYDRLFDAQFNIAPAIELPLWKGGKGTLQWLFPVTNSPRVYGKEGDLVRPGFATISQQFQIRPQLYTNLAVGIFNLERSGIDWETVYHLSPSVSLRGEAAYTGYANVGGYLPDDWTFTTWDQLTWSVGGSYFNKRFSVQANGAVQRFLGGDTGFRVDVTRFFGEVAIGFFVLMTEGENDAGFHVAIPLPGSKRPRWNNRFRAMLPKYFDWEYAMSNKSKSGSYFETRPDENRVEHLFNPVYLKSQVLDY